MKVAGVGLLGFKTIWLAFPVLGKSENRVRGGVALKVMFGCSQFDQFLVKIDRCVRVGRGNGCFRGSWSFGTGFANAFVFTQTRRNANENDRSNDGRGGCAG